MEHRSAATPLCVGRESELSQLAELYRDSHRLGQRFALLTGPRGVGKSRILHEFRGRVRLDGGVVLEGRCEPGHAFGPFAEIVERALRFLGEVGAGPTIELNDLACRLGCHRFWYQHGNSEGAPPEAPAAFMPATVAEIEALERRLRFFDALYGLLRDVAVVRPPVVMLHDLDRADRGTLQLLSFILEGAGPLDRDVAADAGLRALFVASVRTDARSASLTPDLGALRGHPGTIALHVGELDEEGVKAYLQSPEAIARVIQRTGGHPEAIDLLLEADPLTPEMLLERQLAGLPARARALVDALAVHEQPADVELLASISGVTVDAAARTAFSESEIVSRSIVNGRILFAFTRPHSRELAYALLGEERRAALHARCVALFAAQPDGTLEGARHALAARDFPRAVQLSIEAARLLAAGHAHGEAAALLEQLCEACPDVPTAVHEYLADLYRLAGEYRRALEHAEAVRERCPESSQASRRVGDLLTLAGRLDDAAAALVEAHRLADGDAVERTEVEALLAELQFQRASYEEARRWAEKALATAESLRELTLEIHARNTLGKLAYAQQDPPSAIALFETNHEKACGAELGHQQAQALTNLGVTMLRLQDLAGARNAFERAIKVAAEAHDARDRAIATENLAILAHLRRDYATALRHYHEAVALLKRLGNRAFLTRIANNLGELYLSLGDRTRARSLCDFATHMGGTGLPPSVAGGGLLLRGRVEAADGNLGAARASFEAALRTFQRLNDTRVADALLEVARIAIADGDVAEAREVIASMPEPETSKHAARLAIVAVDVERAAGGDTMRAARRAIELAQAAEDDELLLPALTRSARACLDEADLATATRLLERARDVEERLGKSVPPEAEVAFASRRDRIDLASVESMLRTSFPDGERTSAPPAAPRANGRSPSTPPPASRLAEWKRKYPQIIGSSQPVQQVLSLLDKVAPTDALVLVRGESGTGKELVAEALHRNSPRRDRPLIKVNCAALVETLLLSELFGHERGAFTGASARKKGRFELADSGTLFLDEIGDISPKTQVALLRVLQERQFERVGGTQSIRVDVRIIAATHRDLEQMVRDGTFREDLYYRLRGVMIEMPSLRRRADDVEELCQHLLQRIAEERGDEPCILSAEAHALLRRHAWPGNVRELENVLRSATLFAESPVLQPVDFAAFAETFRAADPDPEMARAPQSSSPPGAPPERIEDLVYDRVRGGERSLFDMKKALERECILRALQETGGNITRAASLLGMKRPRLSQLVKQYGLTQQASGREGV